MRKYLEEIKGQYQKIAKAIRFGINCKRENQLDFGTTKILILAKINGFDITPYRHLGIKKLKILRRALADNVDITPFLEEYSVNHLYLIYSLKEKGYCSSLIEDPEMTIGEASLNYEFIMSNFIFDN